MQKVKLSVMLWESLYSIILFAKKEDDMVILHENMEVIFNPLMMEDDGKEY